jgi:hypothetical protein
MVAGVQPSVIGMAQAVEIAFLDHGRSPCLTLKIGRAIMT